jgi:hypothetical protein
MKGNPRPPLGAKKRPGPRSRSTTERKIFVNLDWPKIEGWPAAAFLVRKLCRMSENHTFAAPGRVNGRRTQRRYIERLKGSGGGIPARTTRRTVST